MSILLLFVTYHISTNGNNVTYFLEFCLWDCSLDKISPTIRIQENAYIGYLTIKLNMSVFLQRLT